MTKAAAHHFRQTLQIAHDLQFTSMALWILRGVSEMLLENQPIERGEDNHVRL
ncbi:hypothetical protein TFLX_04687 [Thermoflexales bacterium]|nr:hypothetical protein TFLX_04687 [Thermoflexales bacterium]